MMNNRIYIKTGHGTDSGAVSGGFIERALNVEMANKCADILKSWGYDVKQSSRTTIGNTIADAIKEAVQFDPAIFISVHNNAGGGDGFEVFPKDTAHSILLAGLCEDAVKSIGQNSRGVKQGYEGFYQVLRDNPLDCVVMVEGFFIDNLADRKIADTPPEVERFGEAYANAINLFFTDVLYPIEQPTKYLQLVQDIKALINQLEKEILEHESI